MDWMTWIMISMLGTRPRCVVYKELERSSMIDENIALGLLLITIPTNRKYLLAGVHDVEIQLE